MGGSLGLGVGTESMLLLIIWHQLELQYLPCVMEL